VKEFLSQNNIAWTEKRVDLDRAAAIEMIRRSGQQGVPVTVLDDEVVVGFDQPRLARIIARMRSRAGAAATTGGRKPLGAKVADAGKFSLPGGTPAEGAYVGGVHLGSPAEVAGLRAGDVIKAVNGKPIFSVDELSKALAQSPESRLMLTVARGAAVREVQVQL
jgi:S1-C subfamily serine protease